MIPVMTVAAAPSPAAGTRCLDAYLPLGAPLVPPATVAHGIEHTVPSRVVRIAFLVAPKLPKVPLVGFLYITSTNDVWFGTQTRARANPDVAPIVREIFAASSTATSAQLQRMLRAQDGNAVLFLAQPLRLLKGLGLATLPCVGKPSAR